MFLRAVPCVSGNAPVDAFQLFRIRGTVMARQGGLPSAEGNTPAQIHVPEQAAHQHGQHFRLFKPVQETRFPVGHGIHHPPGISRDAGSAHHLGFPQ